MTDSSDNLGIPSMKPVQEPAGDEGEEPMGIMVRDLNVLPVLTGRDEQADARRQTDVAGLTSSGTALDDKGFTSHMNVTSLGNEKRRRGWDPLATPYGAPPPLANTSGTRGAEDIRPEGIPADGALP